MAIEGPVSELALSDLLQLLHLSRRTGRLNVRSEAGADVSLTMEEGMLTGASAVAPELRLGRLLVRAGRATDIQIRRALDRQRQGADQRLGELLVQDGAVGRLDIERLLRFQIEEGVTDLMRWRGGEFRFEESPPPAAAAIRVRLPVDSVLMEAARRLDELSEVAGAPDSDPLPRLSTTAADESGLLHLQPFEWEVLAEVDGERSLRGIARMIGRGELDVARALYSLAEAGVIELGAAATRPSSDRPADGVHAAADAAILSGDVTAAESLIAQLMRAEEQTAAVHLLKGRLHALGDDPAAAMVELERAIAIDPLLSVAYYHLARVAMKTGDLRRAEQAISIHLRLGDDSPSRTESSHRLATALRQLLTTVEEAER